MKAASGRASLIREQPDTAGISGRFRDFVIWETIRLASDS
jgi:hypothetical protein